MMEAEEKSFRSNAALKMITVDGTFKGWRNAVFLVALVLTFTISILVNFPGFILMAGGHASVPSVADYPTGDDVGKVGDKGEYMAFSGFMVFAVIWPVLVVIAGALTNIVAILEIGQLMCVLVIGMLMLASENVDRQTYTCRDINGPAESDTRDLCRNAVRSFHGGATMVLCAHVLFLIFATVMKNLIEYYMYTADPDPIETEQVQVPYKPDSVVHHFPAIESSYILSGNPGLITMNHHEYTAEQEMSEQPETTEADPEQLMTQHFHLVGTRSIDVGVSLSFNLCGTKVSDCYMVDEEIGERQLGAAAGEPSVTELGGGIFLVTLGFGEHPTLDQGGYTFSGSLNTEMMEFSGMWTTWDGGIKGEFSLAGGRRG